MSGSTTLHELLPLRNIFGNRNHECEPQASWLELLVEASSVGAVSLISSGLLHQQWEGQHHVCPHFGIVEEKQLERKHWEAVGSGEVEVEAGDVHKAQSEVDSGGGSDEVGTGDDGLSDWMCDQRHC